MGGLAWKLHRLAAMPPAEITHRAFVAARDRISPPAWMRWSPAEAAARLYRRQGWREDGSRGFDLRRLRGWLEVPVASAELEPVVRAARELLEGRWSLFGHPVELGDPPRWNRNLLTGAEWPDLPSGSLDPRRADLAGGAKFAWELGRFTWAPDLAIATCVTGEVAFGRRATAWLADFARRQPLGRGIHHTSGIEMAIRVANGAAALALLPPEAVEDTLEENLGLLAQQMLWCRDHPSVGSSANNHRLAELMALVVAGGLLPNLRAADRIARSGFEQLEREVERQFHADGVSTEQAFGYLPFIWELLLIALTAAEQAGLRAGGTLRARLRASLEFARAMRLSDGRLPQVGDEDDGRVLLASHAATRLDLVGNALAAWLDAPALGEPRSLARLLVGRDPGPARAADDGRHDFPEGGWTVWRERGLLVTFDHGPLGLGPLAAHGHADALSITVFRGADGLVVDPGTFAYQEDPAARERCRATPAHATVSFGGRSQGEALAPFLWGRRARVIPAGASWRCIWASGEIHERAARVEEGRITIDDTVRGPDARVVFPLAPGAVVEIDGLRARTLCGGSRAEFEGEGLTPWRLELSEHAPRFSHRVPASRLVADFEGARATTRIVIGPR